MACFAPCVPSRSSALDSALKVLGCRKLALSEIKLSRLASAEDLDDFDAVFFEFMAAARYCEAFGQESVAFVPENPKGPSPDLRIRARPSAVFVECKRLDRMTDASVALRDEGRDCANAVLHELRIGCVYGA
jgi:hypothetical protein